jgi:malonyl CoA-acyl carrier protein transacylase
MTMRLAILCPGQGAQHAGMFDLLREDAQAAAFLARCNLSMACCRRRWRRYWPTRHACLPIPARS